MSKLPQYREINSAGIEKILWSFEDDTLPVRENITIDASSVSSFPIEKGTVMAYDSASNLASPYVNGDLTYGTAYGLLDEEIREDAIGSTPQNVAAIIGVMGTAYESSCVDLDSAAKAAMPQIKFV